MGPSMKSESFSKKKNLMLQDFAYFVICLSLKKQFEDVDLLQFFLGFGFNQILTQLSVLMDIKADSVH